MELLREYSISDKELIAQAKHTLNFVNTSATTLNLCAVFKAKEIEECIDSITGLNKKIQDCTDISKLYIFQQSKILKHNRLFAIMEQARALNVSEQFIDHEPVRLAQAEAARQKIFAS